MRFVAGAKRTVIELWGANKRLVSKKEKAKMGRRLTVLLRTSAVRRVKYVTAVSVGSNNIYSGTVKKKVRLK